MEDLVFRNVKEGDLDYLDEIRGGKLNFLHLKRIKQQEEGSAEYIIAFKDSIPIGHVFINYGGDCEWHECPVQEDLYVKESERRKGYAKMILKYVEDKVKKKGHKVIGLDVEIHEHWIKKFYESLSYKKVSGPHKLIYSSGEEGLKNVTEIVYHLRKVL